MTKPKNAKPYHNTKVSVTKSRGEIGGVLEAAGVESIQWTTFGPKTALRFQFDHEGRTYTARLMVDPQEQGTAFRYQAGGRDAHYERESRRLHRTLFWYVKSKLEAIDAGLETPTQAWLAAIEGPRGHTIYQEMATQLREIVAGDLATMPGLPPAPPEARHG